MHWNDDHNSGDHSIGTSAVIHSSTTRAVSVLALRHDRTRSLRQAQGYALGLVRRWAPAGDAAVAERLSAVGGEPRADDFRRALEAGVLSRWRKQRQRRSALGSNRLHNVAGGPHVGLPSAREPVLRHATTLPCTARTRSRDPYCWRAIAHNRVPECTALRTTEGARMCR